MFDKKYINFWFLFALSIFCFFLSLDTNPAVAAMAVILLVSANDDCDNEMLKIISKAVIVIITIITAYIAFLK